MKVLGCRDVGFDCYGEIRDQSVEVIEGNRSVFLITSTSPTRLF